MYGSTTPVLYGLDMTKRTLMGVDDTRKFFSQRIDAALAEGDDEEDQTIVTRHGKPVVAIVSMDYLRRSARALGEPTDL
jgi:antitoxin (DNA-binding transcriptional repressor) of toxin-antitoxin stability system